ncbi:MAG: c-type cytochrome [Gammaproteobacteria bacterium]|nr:MAG: c-type cytochrome [Gammaproteobacteria bacterium]
MVVGHGYRKQRERLVEAQCTGCHQLGSHAYGPDLCGLSGRKAGTAQGHSYSKPMKDSGIIWNNESLEWPAWCDHYVVATKQSKQKSE